MAYRSSSMYGSSFRSTYSSSSSSSYTSSPSSSFYHSSYSGVVGPAPFDITPTPFSSASMDASCAFPSWPRRSSLSESETSADDRTATSYLSDEELFGDVFDDDCHSTGGGSPIPGASPIASPERGMHHRQSWMPDFENAPLAPVFTEAELLERAQQQRELVRFLMGEKERRRQEQRAKRHRRAAAGSTSAGASSSSKKGLRSKLSAMTPIAEAE